MPTNLKKQNCAAVEERISNSNFAAEDIKHLNCYYICFLLMPSLDFYR